MVIVILNDIMFNGVDFFSICVMYFKGFDYFFDSKYDNEYSNGFFLIYVDIFVY